MSNTCVMTQLCCMSNMCRYSVQSVGSVMAVTVGVLPLVLKVPCMTVLHTTSHECAIK